MDGFYLLAVSGFLVGLVCSRWFDYERCFGITSMYGTLVWLVDFFDWLPLRSLSLPAFIIHLLATSLAVPLGCYVGGETDWLQRTGLAMSAWVAHLLY